MALRLISCRCQTAYACLNRLVEEIASWNSVLRTRAALGAINAGVEMEALTAASTAALTIFDMCKAVSRRMEITDLRLERKIGGKSGTFDRSKGGQ